MSTPLHILFVEDVEDDAALVSAHLRRAGYEPVIERVETAQAMAAALAVGQWQVVLSDYSLPGFGAPAALRILQDSGQDLPFIILSGTINEMMAVEALKAGAHDFVVKNNLARLAPAIERELRQARSRQMRQRAEQRLATTMDAMAEGARIIGFDWRYLYINKAGAAQARKTVPELVGRTMQEAIPGVEQTALFALLRRCMAERVTEQVENEYTYPDGGKGWFHLSIEPVPEGLFILSQDITERKRAEAELADERQLLRTVIDNVPDFIYAKDTASRFTLANQASANSLGRAPDEMIGKTDFELHPRELAEQFLADEQKVLQTGQALVDQEELMYEDGQERWQLTTTMPLRDRAGQVTGLVGISRNITERKRAVEALRESAERLAEANDRLRRSNRALATLSAGNLALVRAANEQELLEAVCQGIVTQGGYRLALVTLAEGDDHPSLRPAAHAGFEPAYVELARQAEAQQPRLPALLASLAQGQPIVMNHMQEAPTSDGPALAGNPQDSADAARLGFASILLLPLLEQGRLLGSLHIYAAEPDAFQGDERQRLTELAGDLAFGIQALRTREAHREAEAQLQRQLAELEAVSRVSAALRTARTLEEMLPLLLQESVSVLHGSAGSVWFYDADSDEVRLAQEIGWSRQVTALKRGEGVPGYVVASGQPYLAHDVKHDPHTTELVRERVPAGRGGACVPLRNEEEVIGALYLHCDQPHEFSATDVRLLTTLAEMAGSAIQRMRLYEQTQRRLSQLSALREIDQAISSSLDVHVTLNVILDEVTSLLHVDAADVLLMDKTSLKLVYAEGRGFHTPAIKQSSLRLDQGTAALARLGRHLLQVADIRASGGQFARSELLAGENFVGHASVPLMVKGKLVGLLEVFQRGPLAADADWLEFLEALAGQAAIALDSAEMFNNLQHSNTALQLAYDATIEGWSRALDLRDRETEGHSQRVTELTLKLAAAMGTDSARLVHLRRGALLHDIGKMGVPDHILLKPGPLTDEEWVSMRRHPTLAYEMLAPISYLRPALEIPYCHHEKWDGKGYPRGLRGEQIPLAARMFAVVDVWDALRSERPYRPAWPEQRVREHIRALAGTHFDPAAAAAFLALEFVDER